MYSFLSELSNSSENGVDFGAFFEGANPQSHFYSGLVQEKKPIKIDHFPMNFIIPNLFPCISLLFFVEEIAPPYWEICHKTGQQDVGGAWMMGHLGAHNWLYILQHLTSTADHLAWITIQHVHIIRLRYMYLSQPFCCNWVIIWHLPGVYSICCLPS